MSHVQDTFPGSNGFFLTHIFFKFSSGLFLVKFLPNSRWCGVHLLTLQNLIFARPSVLPTELSRMCGLKWVASLDSSNVHRDEFSSEVKVVVVSFFFILSK